MEPFQGLDETSAGTKQTLGNFTGTLFENLWAGTRRDLYAIFGLTGTSGAIYGNVTENYENVEEVPEVCHGHTRDTSAAGKPSMPGCRQNRDREWCGQFRMRFVLRERM
eukprot:s1268_g16.t1